MGVPGRIAASFAGRLTPGVSLKVMVAVGAEVYSRRKAIVEPVFGQIGTVQDGRGVLIRGKPAARAQWRFHCAIHNLLQLHRAGGLALLDIG